MNTKSSRMTAILLAAILTVLTAFSVNASGGGGSGGGDNHDKPLVLDLTKSNIKDGEKDVDPNKVITLYFTKNVVNFVVRDDNKKCFSVKDSAGKSFPITVEMGDDQVDPSDTTKRTVTLVPNKPYEAGETYTITVSGALAAKNGRDVLGDDVTVHFTVAGEKTTAFQYTPVYTPTTTKAAVTTTATTTTTTTKAPRTTKPVIAAATGKSTTAAQKTTAATSSVTHTTVRQTVTQSTAQTTVTRVTTSAAATSAAQTTAQTETNSETVPQSESQSRTQTVTETEIPTTAETDKTTPSANEPVSENPVGTQKNKLSPAIIIGIVIVLAAGAAVIIIMQTKKKKG